MSTYSLTYLIPKLTLLVQKLIQTLLKELDSFARSSIKEELASLDPLLRNINVPGNNSMPGADDFDFEGTV